MAELKTLKEFNRERMQRRAAVGAVEPNGIACPKCGHEMVDADPGRILTSDPPQMRIACSQTGCAYTDYRLA